MRQLTVKQKKYLDKKIVEYKNAGLALYSVEGLTADEWLELEKMNNTEVLYQNANRYIADKNIEGLYNNV